MIINDMELFVLCLTIMIMSGGLLIYVRLRLNNEVQPRLNQIIHVDEEFLRIEQPPDTNSTQNESTSSTNLEIILEDLHT